MEKKDKQETNDSRVMTREEVRQLRIDKPDVYITLLKKRHPKTWEAIEKFNEKYGFHDIRTPQMVYNYINDVREWPKCDVCGKSAAFLSFGRFEYSNTCSRLCARRSKTTLEKRKKTNMERYGVEFHTQLKEVKDRIKATNRERYGADCILSLREFQEKVKKTNLERYGVEYPTMSREVRDKRDRNNIEKYGVKSPLQRPEIKEKVRRTTMERFGTYPAPQSLQNYYDMAQKNWEQGYVTVSTGFPEYELLTTKDEYESRQGHLKWRCRLCGREFETFGKTSQFPRCKCQHRDQEEVAFYTFVRSVAPDAIFNTRKILPYGKEIDVYVPSRKIGFEFNGLYWHSELRVPENYHREKTDLANSMGIRLIHVFSDVWEQKQETVKTFIQNIFADQTEILMESNRNDECYIISSKDAKRFHNATNILEPHDADIHIGMKIDDRLVAVASFSPLEVDSYELSQYSATFDVEKNHHVFSELIRYFRKMFSPKRITANVDFTVETGSYLQDCGFSLVSHNVPRYYLSKDFRTKNRTWETNDTLYKIYDCGSDTYELICR